MSLTGIATVALLGVGRIGTVHFENIRRHPNIRLLYVADANTARANELASLVEGCVGVESLDDVLRIESERRQQSTSNAYRALQAVIVCTPTLTHFDLVMHALSSGYAVFVEKPLSLDISQIDAAYQLAHDKNLALLTGYQRRFDPNFNAVYDKMHSGEFGEIHVMRSTSRDNPVPSVEFLKTSGGIIHDCGSHDIDLVRWVIGEDPVTVSCVGSCFNADIAALNDYDTIVMSLKFPSGALATIDLSRHACYGYDQRIEVHSTKGMLQADNARPSTLIQSTPIGRTYEPNCYSFPQRYRDAYRLELEHFIDAVIRGSTDLRINGRDVRTVAIIADTATEALKTGQVLSISL